jgi:hypothetical protein
MTTSARPTTWTFRHRCSPRHFPQPAEKVDEPWLNKARPGRARRGPQRKLHAILPLDGVVAALPFAWQALTTFKPFAESIGGPPTIIPQPRQTVGQFVLCSLGGHAFAKLHFTGRNGILIALLGVPMVKREPGEEFAFDGARHDDVRQR